MYITRKKEMIEGHEVCNFTTAIEGTRLSNLRGGESVLEKYASLCKCAGEFNREKSLKWMYTRNVGRLAYIITRDGKMIPNVVPWQR